MIFRSDDRAQSLQVGAVLLFGFLVIGLTIFQSQAVPEENKEVEFDHSQEVAAEMVEFYNAIFSTVIDGQPRPVSITLGADYNDRLFFIYPPPATGALQTTDDAQLQLHNVTSIENEDVNGSFDNYWANETRNYTTQAITYQPNYRELEGAADHRIEYGVLAAQYPETTQLRIADQHDPVVDGTRITLVLFDGDLQEVDSDTQPVIPHRVTNSTTIEVTNGTNTGGISLELPTDLPEENWNESEPGSILYDEPYVEDVSVADGTATILLDGTVNYTLTLNKVDVGIDPTVPRPTYIQNDSYDGTNSTFRIRNEFNDQIDFSTEVSIYNTTGGSYSVTRNISVSRGAYTFEPRGVDDECGVSLLYNVSNTTSYERLNVTDRC